MTFPASPSLSAAWNDPIDSQSWQEPLRSPLIRHRQLSTTTLSRSYPHTSSIHPHPYHSTRHGSVDSPTSKTAYKQGAADFSSSPYTLSAASTSPGSSELLYTPRQIPNIPNLPLLNYPLPLSTDQHLTAIAVMQERQESWTRAAQSSSSASSASSPGTGSPIQSLGFGSGLGHGQGSGSGAYGSGGRGGGVSASGGGSGSGKGKTGGGGGGSGKGSKPRKKVAKACLSCQKSHLTCDESEF